MIIPEHTHPHSHPHPHDHDHHDHPSKGVWGWLMTVLHIHGHSHDRREIVSDQAFLDNQIGIRTVWIALAALLITAVLQMVIVYFSGSVSLLADTAHNIGDGLNSIPLLIAFYLARRLPTRRYTYGYGRAEDVAGVIIVLSIGFSAAVVFWQTIQRFISPQPITNLGWVAAAGILGFLGNETVAIMQIRVGRKIGSAAMVADGLHARTDGLTSLAVLVAAGGSWLGFPILDPIIGLVIGIAIIAITWDATKTIWYRLMDAIEPELIDQAEQVITRQTDVHQLRKLRMRWVGHQLHADISIAIDPQMTTAQAHKISEELKHQLRSQIKSLTDIIIHTHPRQS